MSKILITGGAGFIGSALARRLAGLDQEVVVLDDMSRGNPGRLAGANVGICGGDVRDPGVVSIAAQGCDAIVHAAYLQGTQTFYANPRQVLDVAVRGMSSVLEACRVNAVPTLMLMSSSEAYQVAPVVPTPEEVPLVVPDVMNSRYSYGSGKIISEVMAIAWQREGVIDKALIVRPHNIYGPDMGREHVIPEFALRMNRLVTEQKMLRVTEEVPFPIQGSGEETRSFCFIDDCIDQLIRLLMVEDRLAVFNVGTMDERTIAQVAYAVANCYGQQIKLLPGKLPQGSPPRRLPDMSKLARMGYKPKTSFQEGLRLTVDWYKANA